jgi:hypothetical protein
MFELFCIKFSISGIDDFLSLRASATVRRYGRALVEVLEEGETQKGSLLHSVAEAVESSELANRISGVFSVAATTLTVGSLVPGLGTILLNLA